MNTKQEKPRFRIYLSLIRQTIRRYRFILLLFMKDSYFVILFYVFIAFHHKETKTSENSKLNYKFLILIRKYDKKGNYNFDYMHFYIPLKKFLNNLKINFYKWDINLKFGVFSIYEMFKIVKYRGVRVIILNSWGEKQLKLSNPTWKLLNRLCYYYDVKIIIISWDSFSNFAYWKKILTNSHVSKIYLVDNPKRLSIPKKLLDLYSYKIEYSYPMPMNLDYFESVSLAKKRKTIFFSGSVNSYRDYRNKFLKTISNNQNELKLLQVKDSSYEEYLLKLKESLVAIDFTLTHSNFSQIKGRSWEIILSGVIMLEQLPSQIDYFFNREQFNTFKNTGDLTRQLARLNDPEIIKNEQTKAFKLRDLAINLQLDSKIYSSIVASLD